MTVTTALYQPEVKTYVPGQEEYTFELEMSGVEAFELWYVDNTDPEAEVRTRAPTTDYLVTFNSQPPIYEGGTVKITNFNNIPSDTTVVSIERNTPIYQLLDFSEFTAFPLKMIEYTLDKHTLICQELAYRKCGAVVEGTEMTQLISFDPYTPFYATELTFALDKIIAILAEIAATATDCRTRPELT